MKWITGRNFEEIYRAYLGYMVSGGVSEIMGASFELTNPRANIVHNKVRKFSVEGTEAMFQWILAGESDIALLHGKKSHSEEYDTDLEGRNTAYGPRVAEQLDYIVRELTERPNTRRAVCMILDKDDQAVADAKRLGETKCEYPCMMGVSFMIRDGRLHAYNVLRSNNAVLTVCIDVYLITRFQQELAAILGVPLGSYHHTAISYHILDKDKDIARKIYESYLEEV